MLDFLDAQKTETDEPNNNISGTIQEHFCALLPSLRTPLRHTEGVEIQLQSFLTSKLDGGERSTPRLSRFTPR